MMSSKLEFRQDVKLLMVETEDPSVTRLNRVEVRELARLELVELEVVLVVVVVAVVVVVVVDLILELGRYSILDL